MKKLNVFSILTTLLISCNIMFSQHCGGMIKSLDSTAISNAIMSGKPNIVLLDRFGNEFSLNQFSIPKKNTDSIIQPTTYSALPVQTNPPPCQAGMFTLHFAPEPISASTTFGFNNATNKAVLCQVFKDISRLLFDVNPTNQGRVNIWVASNLSYTSMGSWPNGNALGFASGFFACPNGLKNVLIENEVMKTLKSGTNSYSNLPTELIPYPSDGIFHGFIAFNFSNFNWYNDHLNTTIGTGQYDLYSVALHEALHALGIYSLVSENGKSVFDNPNYNNLTNTYSTFDQFLTFGNTSSPVIGYNSGTKTWNYTGGANSTVTGCGNTNSIFFNGNSLIGQAIYTAPNQPGSHLSHLSCSGNYATVGCSGYALPSNDNVMAPCSDIGGNFIKRHPNINETKALCDLGYNLNNINGVYAYGDNPSNLSIYKTYTNCSSTCLVAGVNDNGFSKAYNTSLTIPISSITLNDVSATTIDNDIKVIPSNAGTVIILGTDIVFTPSTDFVGDFILTYYPVCSSGKKGNLTYIFAKILPPPLPPCVQNTCNLICNGDFEITYPQFGSMKTKNWQWFADYINDKSTTCLSPTGIGFVPAVYKGWGMWTNNGLLPNSQTWSNQDCSFIFNSLQGCTSNVGYRIFYKAAYSCHSQCVNSGNDYRCMPNAIGYNNKKYVPISAHIWNGYITTTGIKFPLKNNIQSINCNYKLSYDLYMLPNSPTCIGPISIYGYNNSSPNTKFLLGSITPSLPNWNKYTINFNPSTISNFPTTGLDRVLIESNAGSSYQYFIDNVELYNTCNQSLNIAAVPNTVAPCMNDINSISYTVCLNTPQTGTNLFSTKLKVTLPIGATIESGSSFNSNGEYTIPANSITGTSCITLTLNYSLNSSIIIPNQPILFKISTIDLGLCNNSNSMSDIQVVPQINPISITKTVSNQNPAHNSTITYTINVFNYSNEAQNNLVITDVLPNGLSISNLNGFTPNGNTLTRTINMQNAVSPSTPSFQSFTYDAIVSMGCTLIENCATISSSSNSCISGQSCIKINESNNYSVSVSPTTSYYIGTSIILSGTPSIMDAQNTYQWKLNGVNIPNATTINYIATQAGTYTFEVIRNGCTKSANSIIVPCPIISLTSSTIQPICTATNGSISLTPSGGTAPYTYVWNNGTTTQNRTGLAAGNYAVTATDANGCKAMSTYNLTAIINNPNITPTIVQPKCGNPNGSITLATSGGTVPYTYVWNNGTTTQNRAGLGAGTYTVTVTGANGCSNTNSYTLNNVPVTITLNANAVNTTCSQANGSLSIIPSGGTAPYSYKWSGSTATTSSRTGLVAGTYTVTVTDANNCSSVGSYVISNTNNSTLSITLKPIFTCSNTLTAIEAYVSGGTAVSYLWSNGVTTSTNTNVVAGGTYTVSVTESTGCIITATLTPSGTTPASVVNIGAGTPYSDFTKLAAAFHDPSNLYKVSNRNFKVVGNFYIDGLFDVTNCDFNVNPGVKFHTKTTSSNQINIDNSRFKTCSTQLWKGFEMNNAKVLTIQNSRIEDALVAIHLPPTIYNQNWCLSNNVFQNNGVGVYVKSAPSSTQVANMCPIKGNQFTGGVLKAPYANMISTLDADLYNYIGQSAPSFSTSFAGMIIYNYTNFSLGTGSFVSDRNSFSNLNYGFIANTGYIKIANTLFNNINIGDGVAVYLQGWNSSSVANKLEFNGLGNTPISSMTINNANSGILCHNFNVNWIQNSKINSPYYAIRMYNTSASYPYTFKVNNNTITTTRNAIRMFTNDFTNLNVHNNSISVIGNDFSPDGGIYIYNNVSANNSPPISTKSILSNTITNSHTGAFDGYRAIQLYALRGASVKSNNITLNNLNRLVAGISLEGCEGITVESNTISNSNFNNRLVANTSSGLTLPASSNIYPHPVGIYINTPKRNPTAPDYIRCNTINNVRTGLRVTGASPKSTIERNTFNNHDIGLRLDNTVSLPNHINKGNKFAGACNQEARSFASSNWPNFRSNFTLGGGIYFPSPSLPSFWWQGNNNSEPACGGSSPVPIANPTLYSAVETQVLLGTASFDIYSAELVYQTKTDLYSRLKPIQDQLPIPSAEINLINDMEGNTAIQDLEEIHDAENTVFDLSTTKQQMIDNWNASIEAGHTEIARLDSILGSTDDTAVYNATVLARDNQLNTIQQNMDGLEQFYALELQENSEVLDDIRDMNSDLVPTNTVEALEKQFNEVYYSTILKDSFELTELQKNQFYLIANTCPILNSRAVFGARAVVKRFDDTLEYNDADLCDQAGYTYKVAQAKPTKQEIVCTLYPNPAKDITNIRFSNIPNGIVTCIISDIQGREVYREVKSISTQDIELNTKNLINGIYQVQVFVEKLEISKMKLEIVKQ